MKRSVYSLVLADDVIEAVDRLAYSMNTSRSNLINQILAERVSLLTPEMRMKEIFEQIENIMGGRFQLMDKTSDAVLSLRSPLRYKYRPTVKFSFELFRDFSGCVGRLKINFRTQSKNFIEEIAQFFRFWKSLENKYLGKFYIEGVPCRISEGRFERDFYEVSSGRLEDEEISVWVSDYITLTNTAIQLYFDNLDNKLLAFEKIEQLYKEIIFEKNNGTKIL